GALALLASQSRSHRWKQTDIWILCALFFAMNGFEEKYDEDAMFDFVLAVAAGRIEDVKQIAERLAEWFAR
ncbi:hypothetical protein, partial [Burkholderia sp. SIMBA_024]|uniref:hypothetical protein n=1 Tax=Burkholderia sp. SIMBA_024 TaxID=3085768 RepID=UPI00397CAD17